MLALYGLGTTIGAGIYALIGEVAGVAGVYAPLSFLIAAIMAGLTAFSFAELSSRYPQSAGEAHYVQEAFGLRSISTLIGMLVIFAGVVSAAAVVNAFVGYLHEFIIVPPRIAIIAIIAILGAVAAWGIAESVVVASVVTVIEIGGLMMIVWAGSGEFIRLPEVLPGIISDFRWEFFPGLMAGTVLAFFAFIGFEDIVNVAEEAKNPRRILPLAIIITLVVTTIVYLAVSIVSVLAVPLEELAAHDAPLALIYERSTGQSADLLSVIGIVAVLNGALVQIIMASRVLYGLSAKGMLPSILSTVNTYTQTPLYATALVVGIVFVLALGFDLAGLAKSTSIITLCIFALVNAALIRIRLRDKFSSLKEGIEKIESVQYPLIIPILGLLVSVVFLGIGLFG